MAFPTIRTVRDSVEGVATTTHTVNLPRKMKNGNILLVQFTCRVNEAITWPAGYTVLDGASGTQTTWIVWRKIDGSEGNSITITTTGSTESAHVALEIAGGDADVNIPSAYTFTGLETSTAPDTPAWNPDYGTADTLWLSMIGYTGEETVTYPGNCPDNQRTRSSSATADRCSYAMATAESAVDNFDPDAYSFPGAQLWIGVTIAIAPATSTFTPRATQYPNERKYRNTEITTTPTSHSIRLPYGMTVGSIVMLFFSVENDSTQTFPAGWTVLYSTNSTIHSLGVAWKEVVAADSGDEITITTSASGESATWAAEIRDGDKGSDSPEVSALATGFDEFADCPNFQPSWGKSNTMWIAFSTHGTNRTIDVHPTNCPDNRHKVDTSTDAQCTLIASAEAKVTSFDPVRWDMSATSGSRALTIAIRFAGGGGSPPPPPSRC